jgi:AcrR family transcriptional regulator
MGHNSQPQPGRRERRRRETRERIFRAALRLFAQRGFLATKIEDITEAADVGKGTFFNYFPSKEHLLVAFAEMQLGKAQAVVSHFPGEPAYHELMQRLLPVIAEEPGHSAALVRSILAAAMLNAPARRVMRRNFMRRFLPFQTSLLAAGQRRGEIRGDREARELARLVLRNFLGTLLVWALAPQKGLAAELVSNFELLWGSLQRPKGRAHREKHA